MDELACPTIWTYGLVLQLCSSCHMDVTHELYREYARIINTYMHGTDKSDECLECMGVASTVCMKGMKHVLSAAVWAVKLFCFGPRPPPSTLVGVAVG